MTVTNKLSTKTNPFLLDDIFRFSKGNYLARFLKSSLEYITGLSYLAKEYDQLVNWYKGLVDNYALESSSSMKKRMKKHFLTSSQYEYLFWNMAYHKEGWPFKIKIT